VPWPNIPTNEGAQPSTHLHRELDATTTGRWIINPESAMTEDETFAKSERLANDIGKALYNDWQGSVRVSVPM
jgi:hypothetical protein